MTYKDIKEEKIFLEMKTNVWSSLPYSCLVVEIWSTLLIRTLIATKD